jgi:hypothetical protein
MLGTLGIQMQLDFRSKFGEDIEGNGSPDPIYNTDGESVRR